MAKIILSFRFWTNHGRLRPLNNKLNWNGLMIYFRMNDFAYFTKSENLKILIWQRRNYNYNSFYSLTFVKLLQAFLQEKKERDEEFLTKGPYAKYDHFIRYSMGKKWRNLIAQLKDLPQNTTTFWQFLWKNTNETRKL